MFTAPAGAVNTVWNAAGEDVRLMVEFRPAQRSEDVLETLAALAQQGRVRRDGAPRNPFELALLVHEYEDELYVARPPLAIQRLVFAPLARLGRRLGHSARAEVASAAA